MLVYLPLFTQIPNKMLILTTFEPTPFLPGGPFEMQLVATYSEITAFKMLCYLPLAFTRTSYFIHLKTSSISDKNLTRHHKSNYNSLSGL